MEGRPQGGTERVIKHSTQRITQASGIAKFREAKHDHERIPNTFTYNKNDAIPDPPTNESKLPPLHIIYIYIYIIKRNEENNKKRKKRSVI